jgi:protein phosphatase
LRIGALTHPGLVREKNEDYFLIVKDENEEITALIIADGMGGHNSGEIASFMASDCLARFFKSRINKELEPANIDDWLVQGINEANIKVYNEAKENSINSGMGTTISLAVFSDDIINIGHVGDSRVYLFRNNTFEQVTTDHSYIEELIKSGTITKEEARTHPRRNVITRALGNEEVVIPDLYKLEFLPGDILLMCTDGLTNMLDDDEIFNVLNTIKAPEDICSRLVEIANQKGGEDNITVIVAVN